MIHGVKAPIIGKVAFDLTTIDVTNIECNEFDYVTFWGGEYKDTRIENVAINIGMNPYELFTGISKRVRKKYVEK